LNLNPAGRRISAVKLPDIGHAEVAQRKLVAYLLSDSHPVGRGKAAFFCGFGFTPEKPDVLAAALRRHAAANDVTAVEDSSFGTRYVVEGPMPTPYGRSPHVRAVWFRERGQELLRLATAYPLPEPDEEG